MRFGILRNLISRTLSGSGTNWSLFVVKRPGGVVSRAASEHIRSENLQNIQQEMSGWGRWGCRGGGGGRIIETEKECV